MNKVIIGLFLLLIGCDRPDGPLPQPIVSKYVQTQDIYNQDKYFIMRRIQVPLGWIVKDSSSMAFIPDPDHKWLAEDLEKKN